MFLKSYKYRIYPTKEQEILLSKTFGCVRVIWNNNTSIFNSYNKVTNPKPKYQTSTEIRGHFDWMQEVSAATLQQKEIDFRVFRQNYFSKSRKKKIGRPSFKKKSGRQSFRLPNQKFTLNIGDSNLRIEKIGNIPIVIDRNPPKNYRYMSVTVSKDTSNKYFASILMEEIKPKSEPIESVDSINSINQIDPTKNSIGIDLGLSSFLILSSGEKIDNPKWFRENQAILALAQKRLSKKKKGSVRFRKCKLKVSRIHSKVANERKWFHHQTSLDLVRDYDFIGIEDLNVKGMLKNHKLAKSISDAGWSSFINMLKYKAEWNNKIVQKVDRFFPSSKLCSQCGTINSDLKLSDREWICKKCSYTHDRDITGAENVRVEAINLYSTAQGVTCAIRT